MHDKAWKFIEMVGDGIVEYMAEHHESVKPQKITYAAGLCNLYNEMCEFWTSHVEEGDGGGEYGKGAMSKDEVYGELMGAERYYKRWQETGDVTYQQLAKEELRHAGILLDKSTAMLGAEKAKQYRILHEQLTARLEGNPHPHPTMR